MCNSLFMVRILSLDYERFLCCFHPQTQKENAEVLSRLNQNLGLELTKKDGLYMYSISVPKHLQIHIVYKTSGNISNLVDETTSLLEETAKKSGLKGDNYFALNSSRVLPFDVYEAGVHKQILNSLFKRIGLSH